MTTVRLPPGEDSTPTVFLHDNDDLMLIREEILRPVMTITAFDNAREVVTRANAILYGLAAAL